MKYFYPGLRVDDGGVDFNKSMLNRPVVEQVSDTAIRITVETMNMDEEPSLYNVAYKDVSSGVITQVSPNPTSSPFEITGLERRKKYDITIKAIFEGLDPSDNPDELKIFGYVMDEELAGSSLIGNSTDPKDITSNFYKGYLTLNSKVADDKKYTVATRSFSAIKVPQSSQGLLPGGKNSAPKYPSGENASYFSFGTSLRFAADVENGLSGGGMGFFTDDRANKGYYLLIETTSSASSVGRKAIRWVKIQKGKDGVETLAETFQTAIYAGQIYNIDIRVKLDGFNITMIAYVNSPAVPIGWDTGINSAASILSQGWNNFTSTAWVLNNSSTTIPVTDGETTQLHLYGNKLSNSSQLIYTTGDDKDYGIKRPVIFETKWIQRSEDAKSLGEWIKNKVINKGRIIKMEIFGNPLIQVGDIVTVKYDYQNFTGEEPLIVTNIRHTFSAGLKTSITCRTI